MLGTGVAVGAGVFVGFGVGVGAGVEVGVGAAVGVGVGAGEGVSEGSGWISVGVGSPSGVGAGEGDSAFIPLSGVFVGSSVGSSEGSSVVGSGLGVLASTKGSGVVGLGLRAIRHGWPQPAVSIKAAKMKQITLRFILILFIIVFPYFLSILCPWESVLGGYPFPTLLWERDGFNSFVQFTLRTVRMMAITSIRSTVPFWS